MSFLDPLAIALSIGSFWLLAFFWFSPLFLGSFFPKEERVPPYLFYPGVFFLGILLSFFLSLLQVVLRVSAVMDGFYLGIGLFLGLVLPCALLSALLVKGSWKTTLVKSLFFLIVLVCMNGVLAS